MIQSGASGTLLSVMHLLIKARRSHQQDDFGQHDSCLLVPAGLIQGVVSLIRHWAHLPLYLAAYLHATSLPTLWGYVSLPLG